MPRAAIQPIENKDVPIDWTFEVSAPMGGAAGEAFTNPLNSSGMPPAAVLAREAIQNSVDARAEGANKVEVRFSFKNLTGTAKADFVKAAKLSAVASRSELLTFNEPNCLGGLSDGRKPLHLLFVDDFQTTGLAGDPASASSKFFRFLLSLGDGGKEHDEHGTGGSYGFGKSVYSSNSGILTIFAYSRTVDGNGEPTSILFGCGYYRAHKLGARFHTGRAWFGSDQTEDGGAAYQVVRPLRDDAADRMAATLGFSHRDDEQFGTSVLIVDSTVDADGILKGVEDWWWPRILNNLLDVEVISADGTSQMPRPRKRDDLRPFAEAYDIAIGKSPPKPKSEFRKQFNRSEGHGIGIAGFKVLDRLDSGDYIVGEGRVDSVALIRSPLMVVAYHRAWYVGQPAMVGAFVADDAIDDILRSAEPPAHDRWDADARRLQDATGRKRAVVRKVLQGIRTSLKTFQAEAAPPPPPRPKRLSMLERTLASFLSANKRGTQPGQDHGPAPISLTYEQEPKAQAHQSGQLSLSAIFTVRLKPSDEDSEVLVRLKASCPVIVDGQDGESLGVAIKASVPLEAQAGSEEWKLLRLNQGQVARFVCETEPYDRAWTVKFVPEVEPVEIV